MKLNNVQKLNVQNYVREHKSPEEMADLLKVDVAVVNSYLDDLLNLLEKTAAAVPAEVEEPAKKPAKKKKEKTAKAKPEPKKRRTSADIGFATKTPGGREGVTVMTEQASQVCDSHHEAGKYNPAKKSSRHEGCIYRPQTDTIE